MDRRFHVEIKGVVQGVGLRPFIYNLAKKLNLAGFVLNNPKGVVLEIEGKKEALHEFIASLKESRPPLSRIDSVVSRDVPLKHQKDFIIQKSRAAGKKFTELPTDTALVHLVLMGPDPVPAACRFGYHALHVPKIVKRA